VTETLCYANGEILSYSHAKFSPDDLGIVWGAIITDRLRTFGGKLFQLQEHLDRFAESSRLAKVPLALPVSELSELSENLLAENHRRSPKPTEYSFLYLATPGVVPPFPHGATTMTPTLMVLVTHLDEKRVAGIHERGLRLTTTVAPLGTDPHVKHRSRLPWWVAMRSVVEAHAGSEPLYVTPGGAPAVLETASANVAAVIGGTVVFPPTGQVLPGTAQVAVRDLCRSEGIPVADRPLAVADLKHASEMLAMNSTYGLASVVRVDDLPFPKDGEMALRLTAAWERAYGIRLRPANHRPS